MGSGQTVSRRFGSELPRGDRQRCHRADLRRRRRAAHHVPDRPEPKNRGDPHRPRQYYVLFFIQLESRRVCLAGITPQPDQQWMEQMGRNVTMQKWGFLAHSRYLLHDRDSKFCLSFRQLIEAGKVKTMPLPARSPNLNAYAERWVRSVKQECLSKLILFGERPLRRALQQYVAHY